MNLRILFPYALAGLALTSCGYHLGGMKPAKMEDMHTFCVEMFENNTVQPSVGVYMTTAVTNAMQSDGTYRLAPRNEADFIVKGTVSHISRDSLTTSTKDSYISTQIGVTAHVEYELVNRKQVQLYPRVPSRSRPPISIRTEVLSQPWSLPCSTRPAAWLMI